MLLCLSFSFISSLGVGYMMVCTETYPNVLAFCFLDELQKEFLVTYDSKRINSAVRPYSFIEFGEFSAQCSSEMYVLQVRSCNCLQTGKIKQKKNTTTKTFYPAII